MLKIDKAILDIDTNICKNIKIFDDTERGLLSQNILSQLRNYVEYISVKIFADGQDIEINFDNISLALKSIKSKGQYKFLNKFHSLLQITASHYTLDEGNSERLVLKYYEYLLKIKIFLKDKYNLDVLDNIDDFPINTDKKLMEYYEKIVDKINQPKISTAKNQDNDRYYIQKIKPFFVNQKIYYEVTFTPAIDTASKFDRIIAFTKLDISSNYAVKLSLKGDNIDIMGKIMPIQIISKCEISIRPCEINNFAKILNISFKISSGSIEYIELMSFLTKQNTNLVDLIDSTDYFYNQVKTELTKNVKVITIFNVLDKCRYLVKNNKPGSNILRYLLLKLNNKVIKRQYNSRDGGWDRLSGLYLNFGCMPFEQMPFNSSLLNHNIRLSDLFDCLDPIGREHEFLARLIKNNTEVKGLLFTPKSEITNFDNMDMLIEKYNSCLYYKHDHRKLKIYKDNIYIKGYVDDSAFIIEKLKELSVSGIKNYSNSVESWLESKVHTIDCNEKKLSLIQMFEHSRVALIYGSAGTGKSTLINHISNFADINKKIFLTNTNPAIDNLKRKVNASNCTFKTISSFLSTKNYDTRCDLLFIDECSTVSNSDMREILTKAEFKLLVLVGDVFQIESISFGNWFNIARSFISEQSVYELTNLYRSTNSNLIDLWNKVRKMDSDILEHIARNNYSLNLDESIFDHFEEDQIILCLNYDGLYGINNINSFLQGSNPNEPVEWGINVYKIGDPVLFNGSERFAPLIYNNLKGKIVSIQILDEQIQFDIELDKVINELDAGNYDFELMSNAASGNSVIRFLVNEYRSTDDDDYLLSESIVPFQIAYAISIHKAQGLEYESVKIVITNEVGELITHNIFYTAITRAKDQLKIYWTPEVESKVLSEFEVKDNKKDVALLRLKHSL